MVKGKLEALAEEAIERNPEYAALIEFTLDRAVTGDQRTKESFLQLLNKIK